MTDQRQGLRKLLDLAVEDDESILTTIMDDFSNGFTYSAIVERLKQNYDITCSVKTLERFMKSRNLAKRTFVPDDVVCQMINEEISRNPGRAGYRKIWRRLKKRANVKRDSVARCLRVLKQSKIPNSCRFPTGRESIFPDNHELDCVAPEACQSIVPWAAYILHEQDCDPAPSTSTPQEVSVIETAAGYKESLLTRIACQSVEPCTAENLSEMDCGSIASTFTPLMESPADLKESLISLMTSQSIASLTSENLHETCYESVQSTSTLQEEPLDGTAVNLEESLLSRIASKIQIIVNMEIGEHSSSLKFVHKKPDDETSTSSCEEVAARICSLCKTKINKTNSTLTQTDL